MTAQTLLWTSLAALAAFLVVAVRSAAYWRYQRPLRRLAVMLRCVAQGKRQDGGGAAIVAACPPLNEAVALVLGKLEAARQGLDRLVAAAVAEAEMEKGRLAALVNDLHEGVVVCNAQDQVVLFNQVARGLLCQAGEIGLGRPLYALLVMDPLRFGLDLLVRQGDAAPPNIPFMTTTSDGRLLLHGRVGVVRSHGMTAGYVVTLSEVTWMVAALAQRDVLLRDVIALLKNQAATAPDLAASAAAAEACYRSLASSWWPTTEIHSPDLLAPAVARLADAGITAAMTGLPVWLRGDGHALVLAIELLAGKIAERAGVRDVDLWAEADGQTAAVVIGWRGEAVGAATLRQWELHPLSSVLGGMTVKDVLLHHGQDGLIETAEAGTATLRLGLFAGRDGQIRQAGAPLPPRPEFFDFNLLAQPHGGKLGKTLLRDLVYVVFDTETTGLSPMGGDAIVSLAGVRIVNRRILTGETFDRLVDPERPIPPESTRFHGITDDMVAGRPPLAVVLPQFKAFVADAVLVAHNAAFDLKFLRLHETKSGVVFDNPVLDTMLLSSHLDGEDEDESLDAALDRHGIVIEGRHTALGDAMATAALLLRLIDGLEAKGIRTLDDALTTLDMTLTLHMRAQAVH
jgi:DNA polymerase-3 subunit epsilon